MHGPKPLLWVVWLGYVLIGVEVRHLHAKILGQPAAMIPLVFCGAAVILMPLCMYRTSPPRRSTLYWVFSVGMAVGFLGVYFHTKPQIAPFLQLFTAEHTQGPQPLAPLALTGLSTIGLIASRLIACEPIASSRPPRAGRVLDR